MGKEFDSEAEVARVRADVMSAPAPGTDLDSRQRLAKQMQAAAGVDVPEGLSVDPITTEDRERAVAEAAKTRKQVMSKQGVDADAEDKATDTKGPSKADTKSSGDNLTPAAKAAGGDKAAAAPDGAAGGKAPAKPDDKGDGAGKAADTKPGAGAGGSGDDATARARRTTPQGRTTRPTQHGA